MSEQTAVSLSTEPPAGEPPVTPAQGLTILKEVWLASNRLAELQNQYRGKAIPLDKVFGALLGFGDKPDPLEPIKKQLEEINAKLDRVLAGIQEIQMGLLGLGVLTIYLDISDSVFLIDKYSEMLPDYMGLDRSLTDADRKEFVDKILGKRSERDGVAFCAQKILKMGPNGTPLLFDLLFAYISAGAKAGDARTRYLKGAYVFRFVMDALIKALLLELFAVTAVGDQTKMDARAAKVTKKYKDWVRAMIDNSFLPFAESLATLNCAEEYLGWNDNRFDANLSFKSWKAGRESILQSADELSAKLLGRSKAVTLRIVPNVPPIANSMPASSGGGVSAGHYIWESQNKPTTLTKDVVLDKIHKASPPLFQMALQSGGSLIAQHVSRADLGFMEGAGVPIGFEKSKLSFVRLEFDLSGLPDRPVFSFIFGNMTVGRDFPLLDPIWKRIYIEEGHRFPEDKNLTVRQAVLDMNAGVFDLPAEGYLSPVLLTYAYDRFGQRAK